MLPYSKKGEEDFSGIVKIMDVPTAQIGKLVIFEKTRKVFCGCIRRFLRDPFFARRKVFQ